MDLERKALSAPRGNKPTESPTARLSATAASCNGIDDSNLDDSSVKSNQGNIGKRRMTSVSNREISKSRKRKRIEDPNAVVIYNAPPATECAAITDFVERMLLEMHRKRIKILQCQCIGKGCYRRHFVITFETSEHVEIAMSLNGVQFLEHTIYVSIAYPDWLLDKTKKLWLCFRSYFGACRVGDNCRHAHGVLELKLYHRTVLNENRTIYIRHIPFNYPPKNLLNMLRNKFNGHGLSPFFTAFHVRGGKGDGLVEFADTRHAKRAHEILNGTQIGIFHLEVHPWKPQCQSSFVRYFEDEARSAKCENRKLTSEKELQQKSMRTSDIQCKAKGASAVVTPQKQDKPLFRKPDHEEAQSAAEWEDDKRELRRLRDEVYKFKWQQKRFADLEEENNDCKRLLEEAHGDVRYYREKYERERSYAKDVRRMEDKLDHLERENDHLMRENDDLRKSQSQSIPSGSYRDLGNNLQDELRHTRRKYEESRDRIHDLKRELDKTMEENEVLVRDSDRLKNSMERLESNRNRVKMENEKVGQRQDDLQRRLDEALSEISTLNEALATTQLQLKDVESEKGSMNETVADLQAENETLQEEMEQMRMNRAMELGFTGEEEA